MSGETLAKIIVEDLSLPTSYELEIANQVKNALQQGKKALNLGKSQMFGNSVPDIFLEDKEKLCTIEFDISRDGINYKDKFEWDVNNPLNDPAEFAEDLVLELGLPSFFQRIIHFEIKKQVNIFFNISF